MKVPKIDPTKQIWKPLDTHTAAAKAKVMKAEKKEFIFVVRRMQIEANEDWSTAQRGDPTLAKIIAAKEGDKRSTRIRISREGPLTKAV